MAIVFLAMLSLALIKLHYFLYTDFDLAIFAQSARQVLRGSLECSIRGMRWPGDHSSLVLFVLAPFTAVFEPARVLLAAQAAALAGAAWPLFGFAKRRLGGERPALAVALLWLAQPALWNLALFEFHPETLAVPALVWTIAAIDARRTRTALVAAAFALLAREDVALVVLGLALVALLARRPRQGLGLASLAAASLALSFGFLKPHYAGGADYGMLYRAWGATPAEVAAHLLRSPGRAIASLFATPGDPWDSALKRDYWLALLGPWAFLPLLAPLALLPAAPIVAEHLLAGRPEQHTVFFQYTALVLPFAACAAAAGLARLLRRARGAAIAVLAIAFAASFTLHAVAGPFAPVRDEALPRESAWPDGRAAAMRPVRERLLATLPARGDIAASFVFLPRLSVRQQVHSLLHLLNGKYTFSPLAYPVPRDLVGLVADFSWDDQLAFVSSEARGRLAEVIRRNALRPVAQGGECVAYVRGARDTLALLRELGPPGAEGELRPVDRALRFAGGAPTQLFVAPGTALPVRLRWLRTAPSDTVYAVELALLDAAGDAIVEQVHVIGWAASPPAAWPAGRVVEESLSLVVPTDATPGARTLVARPGRLTDQALVPFTNADGEPIEFRLGRIDVSASAR